MTIKDMYSVAARDAFHITGIGRAFCDESGCTGHVAARLVRHNSPDEIAGFLLFEQDVLLKLAKASVEQVKDMLTHQGIPADALADYQKRVHELIANGESLLDASKRAYTEMLVQRPDVAEVAKRMERPESDS